MDWAALMFSESSWPLGETLVTERCRLGWRGWLKKSRWTQSIESWTSTTGLIGRKPGSQNRIKRSGGNAEVRSARLEIIVKGAKQKILLTSSRVASEANAEFSRPLTGDMSKLFSGERGTPLSRGYLILSCWFTWIDSLRRFFRVR